MYSRKYNLISTLTAILFFGYFLCIAITVTANAQEQVAIEGWLTAVWGDEEGGGSSGPFFQITDENAKRTDLIITESARRATGDILALNGKYVSIQGVVGQTMTHDGGEPPVIVSSIKVIAPPPSSAVQLDAQTAALVSGSKPWVSIMCKFSDYNDEPQDLAYFQGMYADNYPGLNHYWREVSYNTVNIDGSNAYGWFDLPQNEAYYNPTDTTGGTNLSLLAQECIAAADSSVDFSQYAGINMMFNTDFDNGYAWGGSRYMTLDGTSKVWSITWEPPWGYSAITVIAHEMGHGFGLPHSSGNYGETYDNEWDVMSDSWANCSRSFDTTYGCLGQHTISYHKDLLGWIIQSQKYTVEENSAANLTLEQLALPATTNYKMVRIPIGGSTTHYYTVEVRRQQGYDYKLPGQGVIIHEVDTSRSRPAYVIDIDGNGDTGDDGAIWQVGEQFSDLTNKIFIDVISATSTGFIISVVSGDLHGDVDGNNSVELNDAIIALRLASGMNHGGTLNLDADVDSDERLGLSEAIFVMQQLAAQ